MAYDLTFFIPKLYNFRKKYTYLIIWMRFLNVNMFCGSDGVGGHLALAWLVWADLPCRYRRQGQQPAHHHCWLHPDEHLSLSDTYTSISNHITIRILVWAPSTQYIYYQPAASSVQTFPVGRNGRTTICMVYSQLKKLLTHSLTSDDYCRDNANNA